ncbi:LAME_0H10154g1_1 [Lachancea meyersii CBS 8951]|uniref:Protein transport protein SEC23 n=1 Tax=Lachancea meyersii CBS 8951 TaxID=1266667 RepID=A0A1G4KG71_9SACH|nr:LAME_0H10154g1_1 [Lachancea meyersii CBS 8951]
MLEPAFNVLPTSRLEAELQMPYLHEPGHVDMLYETNNDVPETRSRKTLQICRSCGAAIMDKCAVIQDQWACSFCNTYNPLQEKAPNTPYEVEISSFLPESSPLSVQNVLVLDLCVNGPIELESLKEVIIAKVSSCSPDASYGLITLNSGVVKVHSTSTECIFSADDSSTVSRAKKLDAQQFIDKFPPLNELWITSSQLIDAVNRLQPENYGNDQRPKRASGLAFFVASLYSHTPECPVSVTAFISGPCTVGPGKVVPKNKKFHIRQHYELDANRDKYFHFARSFYKQLVDKVEVRVFISNLDQVGVVELAPICIEIDQFDSFSDERFQKLALRWWPHEVSHNEIIVFAPKGLLIDGCFGLVSKLQPSQQTYSDTPCGVSGTNRWRSWSSRPSLSFSFQIGTWATKEDSLDIAPVHSVVQIKHSFVRSGKKFVKVDAAMILTTNANMSGAWSVPKSLNIPVALSCLMKQIAYSQLVKSKTHALDLQEWQTKIDKLAARHCKTLSKNYPKLVEFLYHLKWTALLQKRNTSPDEAAIYQHTILSQNREILELLCKPRVILFAGGAHSEVSALNEQMIQENEAMCVDFGTLVLVRYLKDGISLEKAQEMGHSIRATRNLPVSFEKTLVRGSQDRYFISKLIPEGNSNTDGLSLGEYNGVVRKLATCI